MTKTNRNYKSNIDYSSISTMQELREAKLRLRGKLIIKKAEMSMEFDDFKQAVNPMTYVHRFLSHFGTLDVMASSFRQGYNWVSSFIEKKKEKKQAKAAKREQAARQEEYDREGTYDHPESTTDLDENADPGFDPDTRKEGNYGEDTNGVYPDDGQECERGVCGDTHLNTNEEDYSRR